MKKEIEIEVTRDERKRKERSRMGTIQKEKCSG